jgi:hypothetical protein
VEVVTCILSISNSNSTLATIAGSGEAEAVGQRAAATVAGGEATEVTGARAGEAMAAARRKRECAIKIFSHLL